MKSLQEKLKIFEQENKLLIKQSQEKDLLYKNDIENFRNKFLNEKKISNEIEIELKNKIKNIEEEKNNIIQDKKIIIEKLEIFEEENEKLKNEVSLFLDEFKRIQTKNLLLEKEIEICENEKEKHLEQNSIVLIYNFIKKFYFKYPFLILIKMS